MMAGPVDGRPAHAGQQLGHELQPDQQEQVTSSQDNTNSLTRAMLVSLTVGKVDAGVAVLLTEDKRLVRPPMRHRHRHRHRSPALHRHWHRRIPATHPYTG